MPRLRSQFRSEPEAPCLELALKLANGELWRLKVSAGMERFIGAYPLVEGLDPCGPLLRFRAASTA